MPEVAEELIAVSMPQFGVSVDQGTVLEWRVRTGDEVELDQTICEISTDKVEMEVPAPASGTLVDILVSAGETVPVGALLARISVGDRDAFAPPVTGSSGAEQPTSPRQGHSPVVRRIAETHKIDLEQVVGSGRDGRVTKRDVLAFVEARESAEARPTGELQLAGRKPVERGAVGQAGIAVAPSLSPMRRIIAERMTHSLRTAAHCHTFIEVDMSRVEAARQVLGTSPLPIIARGTIEALRAHPVLNARLEGGSQMQGDVVNLGIAVSLGKDGLIVPVIRDAQDLSVQGLAQRIRDVADRARTRRLDPGEVQDGTFTITNLGAFGTLMSTPIINQPEVGILDLQAIVKRAVVVDDAIGIRPMTVLGLGWDHRALDGAQAALFLATLRDVLQSWPTPAA